jgi:hypothetical protein
MNACCLCTAAVEDCASASQLSTLIPTIYLYTEHIEGVWRGSNNTLVHIQKLARTNSGSNYYSGATYSYHLICLNWANATARHKWPSIPIAFLPSIYKWPNCKPCDTATNSCCAVMSQHYHAHLSCGGSQRQLIAGSTIASSWQPCSLGFRVSGWCINHN